MSKHIKILVIGVGIAGPAICYWLKRFGFSLILIEKSAAIRKGGQALDVRGIATHIAREMGIYNQICDMRTRIECGRFVDAAGNVLHEEHGEKFGFRQDDEVEILRGDLVEILMKTIADVPCHFNQSISSIQQNDDSVTVNFNDGTVENYDVIIAADGIHSATRRMIFDKNEYQLIKLGSYLSTFTMPNYLNLNHMELNVKLIINWYRSIVITILKLLELDLCSALSMSLKIFVMRMNKNNSCAILLVISAGKHKIF